MSMIKKVFILIFVVLSVYFLFAKSTFAQNPQVGIVVFVRNGCIHCEDEEKFLDNLLRQRNDIAAKIYRLENPDERKIWEKFTTQVDIAKVTPVTVIGENYLVGFDRPETTGEEIIALVEKAKKAQAVTDLDKVKTSGMSGKGSTCDEAGLVPCTAEPSFYVTLPFIGRIDAQKYPLFFLSAILGFFDGFNPCAMWVLVTFLIILIQVGNRRKMFLFAGTFILAEALMYSLILTVWYKTWDFVKLDTIITPVVGTVAIVGGVFFLSEWRKKELECKVTNLSHRQKTSQKIKELAIGKFTLFTFLAILGIAFSVNIIEFACSIGIPQAFTKILELNQLPLVQSGLMIAVYIFFYMIDDFIVFALALWGAEKLALTTKYSKASNLLGGLVMVILGLMLIFKPNFFLF